MPKLTVIIGDVVRELPYAPGQSLRKLLEAEGLMVRSGCTGNGACGFCLVQVETGNDNNLTENERQLLSAEQIENDIRLACQMMPEADLHVRIIKEEPTPGKSLQYGLPELFEAFVKLAQYIVRLKLRQDIWDHLGKFIVQYFPADWVVFARKDQMNGIEVLHSIVPDTIAPDGIITDEVRALVSDVLENGFLASKIVFTPAPSMTAFLPVTVEHRPEKVMLIGHKTAAPVPSELLDIYLAIAGLAGTTLERLQNERELNRHRAHLEELVGERTAALAESEQRYATTLASIGDAVIAADVEGKIAFMNKIAEELTGWRFADAVNLPVTEVFKIINEHTRQTVEDPVAKVLKLGMIIGLANHTLLVKKDGTEIPVDDSGAPIENLKGEITGVVLVFRNISERRRAEEALRVSEKRVRLKLESILSPEGDIGNLELEDIIDSAALQAILEDFHKLAPLPVSIIDLKGKVLVGVGWQDICTKFHRAYPDSCRYCLESDLELTRGIPAGEYKLYKCKNGMWDVATPLMIGGRHMGYIFSGQFFFDDESPDREFFRTQARKYGFDERAYLSALERVPRISRQALDTGMAFYLKFADIVSKLSYGNIKLARSLARQLRAEQAISESLKEKEILLKELYHRTKNNMNVISNLMSLQANQIKERRLKQLFKEAQNRIQAMALVHEMLYKTKELSKLDLKDYFEQLTKSILASHRMKNIRLKYEIDSVAVSLYLALPCGLIINELLSNSIKHAFPENSPGDIAIRLKAKGNEIELSYSDNGVGLPAGFRIEDSKSLGMRILDGLIKKQLLGDWEIICDHGTKVNIRFDMALQDEGGL